MKQLIKKIIFSFIKPPVQLVYNSYSQAGEDVIMKFLFEGRKIKQPTFLEVGVFLPDFHNNTYLFYKKGARGVCVEADETQIEKIRTVRPEDKVYNIGVGIADATEADFYIFDDAALNTFNKEEAEARQAHGTCKIVAVRKVPLKSINNIIAENFPGYPQLLSMDLEGLDLAVLKTLDFKKYPIPVICVETCTYSENHIKPKDISIEQHMHANGYFTYADTYINTIFVNKNWFYSDLSPV